MIRVLFIVALISLSTAIPVGRLPMSGERPLLSDLTWLGLMCVVFLPGGRRRRWSPGLSLPLYKPWIIYSLLIVIGSVITVVYRADERSAFSLSTWGPTLFFGLRYGIGLGAMIVCYHLCSDRQTAILAARMLLRCGILVQAIVILQLFGVVPDFWESYEVGWQHVGPLSHHHAHLGGYMLILFGFGLQMYFSSIGGLSKLVCVVAMVGCVPAALISGKRSAWVCGCVLILLYCVLCGVRGRIFVQSRTIVIAVVAFLSIWATVHWFPQIEERFSAVFDVSTGEVTEGGNMEGRLINAEVYLGYYAQSGFAVWLLGRGFCSTQYDVLTEERAAGGSHNQLVTVLVELGPLGIVVFLWLFYAKTIIPWKASLSNVMPALAVVSTVLTMVCYSMGGAIFFYASSYGNLTYFFLVYYALALRLLEHEALLGQE